MIGAIAGIGLLFSYLGVAWSGDTSDSVFGEGLVVGFIAIGVWCLLGIFLFPRTVGMALTPAAFATPIAFIVALLRHGVSYGFSILLLGLACFVAQFLIGRLRPESA
jgi:hypothetical protein